MFVCVCVLFFNIPNAFGISVVYFIAWIFNEMPYTLLSHPMRYIVSFIAVMIFPGKNIFCDVATAVAAAAIVTAAFMFLFLVHFFLCTTTTMD